MAARLIWLALAAVLGLAACSSARRGQPDPVECVTAADCAPGPLVNPDDVCCDTGVPLDVFSRKYLEWRAGIRASGLQASGAVMTRGSRFRSEPLTRIRNE